MGKDKLVTVDQLQTVAAKLKELIDNKPDSGSDAEFASITLDRLTITTDIDGKIKYTDDQGNTGTLIVDNTQDQSASVGVLTVDKICDYNTDMSGDVRTTYSLPSSTSASKLASLDEQNHGGGVILTSKYRAYDVRTVNVESGTSQSIHVKPYMYTIINCPDNCPGFNLNLQSDENSACDEWWIDVNIIPAFTPGGNSEELSETIPVQFITAGSLYWVNNDQPSFTRGFTRIRIHVLYNIAEYGIISSNQSL